MVIEHGYRSKEEAATNKSDELKQCNIVACPFLINLYGEARCGASYELGEI